MKSVGLHPTNKPIQMSYGVGHVPCPLEIAKPKSRGQVTSLSKKLFILRRHEQHGSNGYSTRVIVTYLIGGEGSSECII